MDKQAQTLKIAKEVQKLIASENALLAKATDNLITVDFINFGMKLFEWELPEELSAIPLRFVEFNLFRSGKVVLFKHDTLGWFCLPFLYTSDLNAYGQPTKVRPIAVGPHASVLSQTELEIDVDCIIIRDNELEVPPIRYASFYGDKIADLFTAREKNNLWINLPAIIQSTLSETKDKKNALVIKNATFSNGAEIAVVTDAFKNLQLFNIKSQYLGAEIQDQIRVLKNDYLTFLGVDHNTEKKERKITDEVSQEQEETSINLAKRLGPRNDAIARAKSVLNIDLKLNVNKSSLATSDENYQQITVSHGISGKTDKKGGSE